MNPEDRDFHMGARVKTQEPHPPRPTAREGGEGEAAATRTPRAGGRGVMAEPWVQASPCAIDPSDIAGEPATANGTQPPNSRRLASFAAAATDQRQVARQLCAALDRAVALGLLEHAERVARSAAAFAPAYPPLAERLARLRLRQGRPETALAIIEGTSSRCASLRLLRAICLLLTGRKLEAHLDLHEWCRRAIAPLDARVLLALLEWESGDAAAAVHALQANLKHLEDPRSLQTLLLLAVEAGKSEQARAWADRLGGACQSPAGSFEQGLLLRSLDLHRGSQLRRSTARQIEVLAVELVTCEGVIGSLVQAQLLDFEPRSAAMLTAAIERALPDLGDRAPAMESLARLALTGGDMAAARTWTQRGLATNPLSATLTMLWQQIESLARDRATPTAQPEPAPGLWGQAA